MCGPLPHITLTHVKLSEWGSSVPGWGRGNDCCGHGLSWWADEKVLQLDMANGWMASEYTETTEFPLESGEFYGV